MSYESELKEYERLLALKEGGEEAPLPGSVTGYLPNGAAIRKAAAGASPGQSGAVNKAGLGADAAGASPGPAAPRHQVVCFADVPDETPEYLVHPYVPQGSITILQGDPGTGKTIFACKLAAEVTRGGGILEHPCRQGSVLILSTEDGLGVIKARIKASGADLARCFFLTDAGSLTFDSREVEEAAREHGAALIIFDPIQAFLGERVDMHRANETRPVLARLTEMAARLRCAVVLVAHLNKGLPGMKALYRTLGSMDIVAAARSVLHAGLNPSDPEQRVVCHVKSSAARAGSAFAFRIGPGGGAEFDGYSHLTVEDLMAPSLKKGQAIPFEEDPAVVAVTRLLEENPRGVFVSYEQLTNYAVRMFGYCPCASGRAWREKLNGLSRELMEKKRVRMEFVSKNLSEHVELGEKVPGNRINCRGVWLLVHVPTGEFQTHLPTMKPGT